MDTLFQKAADLPEIGNVSKWNKTSRKTRFANKMQETVENNYETVWHTLEES